MAREVYEFRVNHTDKTTTAWYGSGWYATYLEEWFGRSLEDFSKGMAGRGFRYRVEENDISGRRWDSHYWEKN